MSFIEAENLTHIYGQGTEQEFSVGRCIGDHGSFVTGIGQITPSFSGDIEFSADLCVFFKDRYLLTAA